MSADAPADAPAAGGRDAALRRTLARDGQRLPPAAVLLAVRTTLGETASALGTAVLASVVTGGGLPGPRRLAFFGLIVLVALGVGVARWAVVRWALTDEGIAVRSGAIVRAHRLVPYARLQAVDVTESLAHRLLGLATVRADTPGGAGAAEVRLDGLRRADAEALRARLLERRAAETAAGLADRGPPGAARAVDAADGAPAEVELLRLTAGRLALGGATANLLAPLGAATALAANAADDLLEADAVRRWLERAAPALDGTALDTVTRSAAGLAVVALALALAALALTAVVAAAAYAVRYHGYRLVRRGRVLSATYGVATRAAVSVSLDRVQAARVRASPLRRAAGLAEVRAEVAGSRAAGGAGGDGRSAGPLVPVAAAADVPGLVAVLVPSGRHEALRFTPSDVRRRWKLFRWPAALIVAAAGVGAAAQGAAWLALLLLLLPAWGAAHLAWRTSGWAVDGDVVAARTGVLGRTTVVAPRTALRGVRLSASPFQHRAGLVTVTVDVAAAGGVVRVPDVRMDAARAIAAAAGVGEPLGDGGLPGTRTLVPSAPPIIPSPPPVISSAPPVVPSSPPVVPSSPPVIPSAARDPAVQAGANQRDPSLRSG